MQNESYRDKPWGRWQFPPGFDPTGSERSRRGAHPRHDARTDRSRWNWLLWVPVVLAITVPAYNHMGPSLFGVPFFYWWQLGLAGVCSGAVMVVYLATKDRS